MGDRGFGLFISFLDPRGQFLNKFLRLQKSSRLGAKMNWAPPLRRRELAPTEKLAPTQVLKNWPLATDTQSGVQI
jgi:hypothetical protein